MDRTRTRDRDHTGAPRNARPRDALGRPLPYGSVGVEQLPDDLDPTPDEAIESAQTYLERGMPFHAHEMFEAVWRGADDDTRTLWKGLAQYAAGITHLRRGNPAGGATLLRRAVAHIAPYVDAPPHARALADAVTWAERIASACDDGGPPSDDPPPLRAPGTT